MTTRERMTSREVGEGVELELITNFSEMDLDLVRELIEFWGRQSSEDIYFRWFASRPPCEAAMTSILRNYVAMIVAYGDIEGQRKILGYVEAGNDREEPEFIELGVAVDRNHRKKHLASILVERLCEACNTIGVNKVKAVIMPGNVAMTKLIQKIGKDNKVERRYEGGCEVYRISSR